MHLLQRVHKSIAFLFVYTSTADIVVLLIDFCCVCFLSEKKTFLSAYFTEFLLITKNVLALFKTKFLKVFFLSKEHFFFKKNVTSAVIFLH